MDSILPSIKRKNATLAPHELYKPVLKKKYSSRSPIGEGKKMSIIENDYEMKTMEKSHS